MILIHLHDGIMKNTGSIYVLSSFFKQMACLKNPENANRINLILTNKTPDLLKVPVLS